jgi:hypothetical protein
MLTLALIDAILRTIWVEVSEVQLRWAGSLGYFLLLLFLSHLLQ